MARPTDPAAVTACFGMTSGRTTQVTGPRPTLKAATNERMPMTERAWASVLRPTASRSAATDMMVEEKSKIGLDPTRWASQFELLLFGNSTGSPR
jgi:hypothetical protein